MSKIIRLKNRFYADYFMPSKLGEYEKIIKWTIEEGYEHLTFREYYQRLMSDTLEVDKKYFINRHDIDTDVATAKEFFKIEQKFGVFATYYFRHSTLDYDFMKELEAYGSEASYHFEEIADYCKQHHIKSKEEVFKNMSQIEELFSNNFKTIEKNLGKKLETVCSHGDFVNRKLGIINNELLKNSALREELGIRCETYDTEVKEGFDAYVSDGTFSMGDKAEDILKLFQEKNVVCMLSHPREWCSSVVANTKENLKRIYEGVLW